MKVLLMLFCTVFALTAQDTEPAHPRVTINKMSDQEYGDLTKAAAAMQKAAEAYQQAADSYDAIKTKITNKYDAVENHYCGAQKIVDWFGQYIVVEERSAPTQTISSYGCGVTFYGSTMSLNPQ